MGHASTAWRNTTFLYKDRIFDHATWAVGALAIGIGVLPLIVGVAALARPKEEPRTPETRAFVVTSAAALGAFLWYAGIKGAYVSTVFATYVYERNVIYLAPLLFAGTALAFTRGVGQGLGHRSRGSRRPSTSSTQSRSCSSTRTTRPTASRSSPSRIASSAGPRRRSRTP